MGVESSDDRVVTSREPVVVPTRRDVREEVVVSPAVPQVSERRVLARPRFNPAQVVAVIEAIALGVIGAVAVARAGLDGPLDRPIVEVAGVTHTAILGLIEIGMAVVLLLAGLSRDRSTILFFAVLFGTASLVAAIEPSVGGDSLAIERGWAIVLTVAFSLLAVVALVAPSISRTYERVDVV